MAASRPSGLFMKRTIPMAAGLLYAGTALAKAPLEHRVGLAGSGDVSYGWVTDITAVGAAGGGWWSMHGRHAGLQVELLDRVLVAHQVPQNVAGVRLSYAHLFGDRAATTRGVATIGAEGLFFSGLLPVLPFFVATGGAEWGLGDRGFLRAEAQAFFAPAPALGLGPRLSGGWSF